MILKKLWHCFFVNSSTIVEGVPINSTSCKGCRLKFYLICIYPAMVVFDNAFYLSLRMYIGVNKKD